MLLRKSLEADLADAKKDDEEDDSEETKVKQPTALAKESCDGQLYTCETAQYFFLQEVLPRWERFIADTAEIWSQQQQSSETMTVDSEDSRHVDPNTFVRANFPFTTFLLGQQNPPEDLVCQLFPVSWLVFLFCIFQHK